MKLVRYGRSGREKPGLIDADGKLRDLSGIIDDIGPEQLSDKALARLARIKPASLPANRPSRVTPATPDRNRRPVRALRPRVPWATPSRLPCRN